jgi:hypothetical protein
MHCNAEIQARKTVAAIYGGVDAHSDLWRRNLSKVKPPGDAFGAKGESGPSAPTDGIWRFLGSTGCSVEISIGT